MAYNYDNHDYWIYGGTNGPSEYSSSGRTVGPYPTSEYSSSGQTIGPYPTAPPRSTDGWVGDTWRKADHDATYGRSTLSSYPHATRTAPARGYAVSGNKLPGMTTGRTYDRRGSFDEYVMKVATNYITPSRPVSSSSSYVLSQNPNEYNNYFNKIGSDNLRPGYTNNNDMVRSSGAPISEPTDNIGLAMDYLKKEATVGSTAPSSSQYGVHRTTHDVHTLETVVDPSRRYGNVFRRR